MKKILLYTLLIATAWAISVIVGAEGVILNTLTLLLFLAWFVGVVCIGVKDIQEGD